MIRAPKDIMIHDDEIAGHGIALVGDELVDALQVVHRDGQSGETARAAEEKPHDQKDLREPDPSLPLLHESPDSIPWGSKHS